jgi:hypothetical protein
MHMQTKTCVYICIYIYICRLIYTCIYIYVYMIVHIYLHTYMYIYICIYIHTHKDFYLLTFTYTYIVTRNAPGRRKISQKHQPCEAKASQDTAPSQGTASSIPALPHTLMAISPTILCDFSRGYASWCNQSRGTDQMQSSPSIFVARSRRVARLCELAKDYFCLAHHRHFNSGRSVLKFCCLLS